MEEVVYDFNDDASGRIGSAELSVRAWRADVYPLQKLFLLALAETRDLTKAAAMAGCGREEITWMVGDLVRRGIVVLENERPPRRRRRAIPVVVRARIMERDEFTCQHCGRDEDLTLDHIHPVLLGGSDDDDNLQVLCRSCNSRKGARWAEPVDA